MNINIKELTTLHTFHEYSTGGGCKALWSDDLNTLQDYILITDADGCDLPVDNEEVCIGVYNSDGMIDHLFTNNQTEAINYISTIIDKYGY